MIVRIDGREIECSVDEYKELFIKKENIVHAVKQDVKTKSYPHGLRRWTKKEEKYIKQNFDFHKRNYDELAVSIGRSDKAIINRVQKLGLLRSKESIVKIPKIKKTIRADDVRRKRMSFINNRATNLQVKYNWSREKAMSQANMEWNNKNKNYDLEEHYSFPKFSMIPDNNIKNIIPFIHHMVSNNEILTQKDISIITNTKDGVWNVYMWDEFLKEFIEQSRIIANYFNVRNRFSIEMNDSKNNELRYGK